MPSPRHVPLSNYFENHVQREVFVLTAIPQFSPIDFNLEFLRSTGWSVSADRFRFHFDRHDASPISHPLGQAVASVPAHILIRKLDKEEDYIVVATIYVDGKIRLLSNDESHAHDFLGGLLLGFPPSFKSSSDLDVQAVWITDAETLALFTGMLAGATSWDPMHDLPPSLGESIHEAQKSLEIGNYKSCVVMSRRALEGLLKFAHKRLLGKEPVKKGKGMMLSDLINAFRASENIPQHLLHLADSLRLLGNVPGAHASDIPGYQFTKYDAEFSLSSVIYFSEQYFTKIDKDVGSYYSLEIDLSET